MSHRFSNQLSRESFLNFKPDYLTSLFSVFQRFSQAEIADKDPLDLPIALISSNSPSLTSAPILLPATLSSENVYPPLVLLHFLSFPSPFLSSLPLTSPSPFLTHFFLQDGPSSWKSCFSPVSLASPIYPSGINLSLALN